MENLKNDRILKLNCDKFDLVNAVDLAYEVKCHLYVLNSAVTKGPAEDADINDFYNGLSHAFGQCIQKVDIICKQGEIALKRQANEKTN